MDGTLNSLEFEIWLLSVSDCDITFFKGIHSLCTDMHGDLRKISRSVRMT